MFIGQIKKRLWGHLVDHSSTNKAFKNGHSVSNVSTVASVNRLQCFDRRLWHWEVVSLQLDAHSLWHRSHSHTEPTCFEEPMSFSVIDSLIGLFWRCVFNHFCSSKCNLSKKHPPTQRAVVSGAFGSMACTRWKIQAILKPRKSNFYGFMRHWVTSKTWRYLFFNVYSFRLRRDTINKQKHHTTHKKYDMSTFG